METNKDQRVDAVALQYYMPQEKMTIRCYCQYIVAEFLTEKAMEKKEAIQGVVSWEKKSCRRFRQDKFAENGNFSLLKRLSFMKEARPFLLKYEGYFDL